MKLSRPEECISSLLNMMNETHCKVDESETHLQTVSIVDITTGGENVDFLNVTEHKKLET